jgi:chromosome segregation ATPase
LDHFIRESSRLKSLNEDLVERIDDLSAMRDEYSKKLALQHEEYLAEKVKLEGEIRRLKSDLQSLCECRDRISPIVDDKIEKLKTSYKQLRDMYYELREAKSVEEEYFKNELKRLKTELTKEVNEFKFEELKRKNGELQIKLVAYREQLESQNDTSLRLNRALETLEQALSDNRKLRNELLENENKYSSEVNQHKDKIKELDTKVRILESNNNDSLTGRNLDDLKQCSERNFSLLKSERDALEKSVRHTSFHYYNLERLYRLDRSFRVLGESGLLTKVRNIITPLSL